MSIRVVTATYSRADGQPCTGLVRIAPNAKLVASSADIIYPDRPVVLRLDATGSFSATLVTTDTAGISPSGWAYVVTEMIYLAPKRSYTVQIPAGTGELDLSDLTPLEPAPETVQYVLLSTFQAKGDLLTFGDSGLTRLPVGTNGHVLTADSGVAEGLRWGVAGSGGTSYYEYTQSSPSATWTINHGLGYRPSVSVEDADGNQVDAGVSWPSSNSVIVALSATMTGKAHLS